MEFSSLIFLCLFFPVFIFFYFINKSKLYKNIILLIFSLIFYAYGEPIYILLMLVSITINYYIGILIDKFKSKWYLIIGIIFNILLLVIFKYSNFIIDIINSIFNLHINNLNIALPIGISFYTFQALSYIIDVYLDKVKVQKKLLYLACYIAAFPQLVAGPIVKYQTVNDEISNRVENYYDFASGVRLFIIGLSKKILISNNVSYIVDNLLLQNASNYGFIGAILIAICYTLQIYFDFSGYSDMAIGIGRMIGFHYNKNFNYPYVSKSITEFFRRWHISLSSWFKEYVYIPLGGNRTSRFRFILNILIVWMLTGLWHGANFNFLLWGIYYGIILVIEKILLKKYLDKLNILSHIYTLLVVIIGWIIFRIEDFNTMIEVFKSLTFQYGLGDFNILIITQIIDIFKILSVMFGIIFSFPIIPKLNNKFKNNNIYVYVRDFSLIVLFFISLIFIANGSYNPFIYFRF